MGAPPLGVCGRSESGATLGSTSSTSSSRSPFARESLGDTVIHFDQVRVADRR